MTMAQANGVAHAYARMPSPARADGIGVVTCHGYPVSPYWLGEAEAQGSSTVIATASVNGVRYTSVGIHARGGMAVHPVGIFSASAESNGVGRLTVSYIGRWTGSARANGRCAAHVAYEPDLSDNQPIGLTLELRGSMNLVPPALVLP